MTLCTTTLLKQTNICILESFVKLSRYQPCCNHITWQFKVCWLAFIQEQPHSRSTHTLVAVWQSAKLLVQMSLAVNVYQCLLCVSAWVSQWVPVRAGSKQTHPVFIHTLASSTSVQLRASVNETKFCTILWTHLCREAQEILYPF